MPPRPVTPVRPATAFRTVVATVGVACVTLAGGASRVAAQGGIASAGRPLVADLSRVAVHRDSLVAFDADGPAGHLVASWSRAADGAVRYAESTALEDLADYVVVVRFDAGGRMRRVLLNGQAGETDLALDLAWDGDGRVRGLATAPSPIGTRLVAVDTQLAPHVLDVNAVLAVLPALDLDDGLAGTLAIFRAPDRTEDLAVRVTARERITIGGRAVDAWRIEVRDAARCTTYHLAVGAPHAVLRIATDGAPVRFERASPPD